MMEFKCKQFSLNHSQSTMKVGTDAILLASVVADFFLNLNENSIKNILDIGAGSGILSLCMSQVFENAQVLGIDIDKKSVIEAKDNFFNNKFSQRMSAECISVQDFAKNNVVKFDLIISNPPFFTSSLQSPDIRRTKARHNSCLSLQDFVLSSSNLLSVNGYVAIILPGKEMEDIILLFESQGIVIKLIMDVFARPKTQVKRKICIFKRFESEKENIIRSNLYIRTENNDYSQYYNQLTSLFLL